MSIELARLLRDHGFYPWEDTEVKNLCGSLDLFCSICELRYRTFICWTTPSSFTLAIDGQGRFWVSTELYDLRQADFIKVGLDDEHEELVTLH